MFHESTSHVWWFWNLKTHLHCQGQCAGLFWSMFVGYNSIPTARTFTNVYHKHSNIHNVYQHNILVRLLVMFWAAYLLPLCCVSDGWAVWRPMGVFLARWRMWLGVTVTKRKTFSFSMWKGGSAGVFDHLLTGRLWICKCLATFLVRSAYRWWGFLEHLWRSEERR